MRLGTVINFFFVSQQNDAKFNVFLSCDKPSGRILNCFLLDHSSYMRVYVCADDAIIRIFAQTRNTHMQFFFVVSESCWFAFIILAPQTY